MGRGIKAQLKILRARTAPWIPMAAHLPCLFHQLAGTSVRMFPGAIRTVCAAVCIGLGFGYMTITATSCLHVTIFQQREAISCRVSSSRAGISHGSGTYRDVYRYRHVDSLNNLVSKREQSCGCYAGANNCETLRSLHT